MSKVRSPNFPVVDLPAAIESVGKIYLREKRGKFPKESAARHLGYTSINGRSLGMIAALRAYGLLEGRGNDLVVTPDAIALLEAPQDSHDRLEALERAISAPPMFQRIMEQYPGGTSPQTLKWWLIQQGFTSDGADKATAIYLRTRELVTRNQGAYEMATDVEREGQLADAMQSDPKMQNIFHGLFETPQPQAPAQRPKPAAREEGLAMAVHERVLQSGMLSKQASYRVIVSGPVGIAEIERLIAKIEMDKDILSEPDDDFTDPATDGVDISA
ncbi:hypothetical protein [Sphingomonas sp. URHD0057]|uniref:hypothetical protein n=1 Tax=Sphingomonas sp. URHD0057 TaxID=1380389 RepID=UPI00048DE01F|nr:hypothetical protein [Sphingomonas sp. URHD0057]